MPQSGADEPPHDGLDEPRPAEARPEQSHLDQARPDRPRPDRSRPDEPRPAGDPSRLAESAGAPAAPSERRDGAPGPDPSAVDGPGDDEHPVFDALGEDDRPDAPAGPSGLRRAVTRARERATLWDDGRRSTSFVPPTETVQIDLRRHPFVMVPALLRTVTGLVVVVGGPRFWPLVVLAAAIALWALARLRTGLRRTAMIAAGTTVGTAVLLLVAGPVLCVLALLTWLLEDVADWWSDRLVISDKRIYRRYGVITGHSPSISLMGVVYIDASVPPLGRLLHYGTLQLDSAAQEDAPLSRLELVPDVVAVSHEILRLRSAAMPRFPMA